jgi:type IV pilus assembly protein PilA
LNGYGWDMAVSTQTPAVPGLASSSRQAAFTLIELLVVILIIGILIAIAVPTFLNQQQKAQNSAAQQTLAVAYKDAKANMATNGGTFPDYQTLAAQIASAEPEYTVGTAIFSSDQAVTAGPYGKLWVLLGSTGSNGTLASTNGQNLYLADVSKSGAVCTLTVTNDGPPIYGNCGGTSSGSAGAATGAGTTNAAIAQASNTSAPSITGATKAGWTSYANKGSWSSATTITGYTYQWLDCTSQSTSSCSNISGATNSSYVSQSSDVGQYLGLAVSALNGAPTPASSTVIGNGSSSSTATPVTTQNDGNASGNYGSVMAAEDASGIVHLTGLLKATSNYSTGTAIGQLPAGDAPAITTIVTAEAYDNTDGYGDVRLDISATGAIYYQAAMSATGSWHATGSGASEWISLSNIEFPAASTTMTPLAFNSGYWENYNTYYSQTSSQAAGYLLDGNGMVHLSGLAIYQNSSHYTDASGSAIIGTLPCPADCPAHEVVTRALESSPGYGYRFARIDITTSGQVIVDGTAYGSSGGGQGTWVSLDNIEFPATTNSLSFQLLTMQTSGGWAAYNAANYTPQYAVATNGIGYALGLIYNTADYNYGTVATIPSSFPGAAELGDFLAYSTSSTTTTDPSPQYQNTRIDITPSGSINDDDQTPGYAGYGGTNSWISLDEMSWVLPTSNLDWQPITVGADFANY